MTVLIYVRLKTNQGRNYQYLNKFKALMNHR